LLPFGYDCIEQRVHVRTVLAKTQLTQFDIVLEQSVQVEPLRYVPESQARQI